MVILKVKSILVHICIITENNNYNDIHFQTSFRACTFSRRNTVIRKPDIYRYKPSLMQTVTIPWEPDCRPQCSIFPFPHSAHKPVSPGGLAVTHTDHGTQTANWHSSESLPRLSSAVSNIIIHVFNSWIIFDKIAILSKFWL